MSTQNVTYPENTIALWGPSSSGKTWLMGSLAQALMKMSFEDDQFDYTLVTPDQLDPILSSTTHLPTASGVPRDYWWMSQRRPKPKYQTSSRHIVSSHSHQIVMYDAAGTDILEANLTVVMQGIENASCVIAVLDPHAHRGHNYSQEQYKNDIKALLDRLRKRHTYIAVCVTKIDSLGVYRDPESLIEAYFGAEMFRLLESYRNARQHITMEYFSVSAMGYLDPNRQVPNFDPMKGELQDANRWEPYRVESPFFWLFNEMEKERLRNTSGFLGLFFRGDRLAGHLPYPVRRK